VGGIFQEAGVQGIKYNVIHNLIKGQETKLVETFFKNFPDFPPNTALAKLVQLVACEETLRIRCAKSSKDNFTGLKKLPLNKINQAYMRASIRYAQKHFSVKIFGSGQAEEYLNGIRTAFLAHRSEEKGSSGCKKRKERNEQLRALVEEINTRFPLTSR